MNDAVLIQQVYPGLGMDCLLDLTQERHAQYCEAHGFDYQPSRKFIVKNPDLGQWAKVELIRRAMGEYKYIVWLDADAFIADISVDLRQACEGIGAVKFYTPYTYKTHYNVGVLYISNSEETRAFVAKWQAGFPGPKNHREQTIFNDLAGGIVRELPPTWNYTIDRHFGIDAPIVRGYHSIRGFKEKLSAMAAAMQ